MASKVSGVPVVLILKGLGLVNPSDLLACVEDETRGKDLSNRLIKEMNYGPVERVRHIAKFCLAVFIALTLSPEGGMRYTVTCPRELRDEVDGIRQAFARQGIQLNAEIGAVSQAA